MTAYQTIYDEAIGNYGLFSTDQAKELGISNGTLAKLAHRGRLEHLGYGLYRIDKFVPNANGLDAYACAVARFGAGGCLWGPSVLAARELCPTDPARIFVAVPGRFRGRVPAGIVLKNNTPCPAPDNLEGIPAQPVDAAILSSQHVVELPRLLEAVDAAKAAGLLDEARARNTVKELYKHD